MDCNDEIFVVMESGYENTENGPVVNLYSRNYNDKFKTVTHSFPYSPYFYCPSNESHISHPLIVSVDDKVMLDAKGREIKRVNVKIPGDVPKVRDLYSWTDESDILFDKRFLVDHRIRYAYRIANNKPIPVDVPHILEPRIAYFDIETWAPEGIFPNSKEAAYPIVSIQVMDSYTENIVVFTFRIDEVDPLQFCCNSEKQLLDVFCKYVHMIDFDILTAWNSDAYDIPYIINRSKKVGSCLCGLSRYGEPSTKIVSRLKKRSKSKRRLRSSRLQKDVYVESFSSRIPGRAVLDEMEAFKRYNVGKGERESNGLKSVISDVSLLEDAAFSYEDIGYKIDKVIIEKRFTEFIQYCKNDVIALRVIDKKLGLFDFFEYIDLFPDLSLL